MLVRIRSKDGNFRFEVSPSDDVSLLLGKILETTTNADPDSITLSNQPRGNQISYSSLAGRSIQTLGLRHGDLLFVSYKENTSLAKPDSDASQPVPQTQPNGVSPPRPWQTVVEDSVDKYWGSQSGKISRKLDSAFCKHGPNGMCDYCMPLEPYDLAYHKENAIKHLSFHTYLKKVSPKSAGSSTATLPPLTPLSYQVRSPCPTGGHPPWPESLCTSCQPSAITLQPQPFRMVDHLEIASSDIIERFLHAWRQTGLQRFGWLIGHYEPYDKVPMGIKAVVEAICEPPQQGEVDGLSLGLPWADEESIRNLSSEASKPLTIVGYVFTDLQPSPEDRTKTAYKRHPNSYTVSSLEAIFAATVQKANPTPTQASYTGLFSSRMVTMILTANAEGNVDILTYQVSEQAEAMVDADMIEASVDPGIVRVKKEERTKECSRYVPDVFFTYKNEYGLEVKKSAKPAFPVEYLLVNVTHGFPQNSSPVFRSASFAIENRPGLEDQSIERVIASLQDLGAPSITENRASGRDDLQKRMRLAEWLSDWHLILFLSTTGLYSPADTRLLMKVVSSPALLDDPTVLDPVLESESWQTLMTFARETAAQRPPTSTIGPSDASTMDQDIPHDILDQIAAQEAASGGAGGGSSNVRLCPHCTFENSHGGSDCEVCGLPL